MLMSQCDVFNSTGKHDWEDRGKQPDGRTLKTCSECATYKFVGKRKGDGQNHVTHRVN